MPAVLASQISRYFMRICSPFRSSVEAISRFEPASCTLRTMRLFIAIPVPAAQASAITVHASALLRKDQAAPVASSVRLAHPADLHVTMCFLGTTPGERIHEIETALCGIERPQFVVETGALGAFAHAGVVYLDVVRSEPLLALAEAVVRRMEGCGFRREARSYHPHITVARMPRSIAVAIERRLATPGSPASGSAGLRFDADRFNLYRTSPQSDGSKYESLRSFALRSAPRRRSMEKMPGQKMPAGSEQKQ